MSRRLTQGQCAALTCVVAGAICEVALCVALNRWPPFAVPLGAGIGSGGFLFMLGQEADEIPAWFGVTLAVCASIGVLLSQLIRGHNGTL